MAFPTIAQIQLSSRASNAVDDTVTLPTSTAIAAGDLIIIFHFTDGAALSATVPGSWVEIKDAAMAGSPNGRVFVAYLIASGGETSVTVTKGASERFTAIAIKVLAAEWHGVTPPEISTGATGTSATPDPDSLTASWGSADNLWVAIMGMDDSLGTNTVDAYPYASNNQKATAVSSAAGGAICTTESAVATLDPSAYTIAPSDEWWAGLMAIRPAVGGITGTLSQTQAGDSLSATGALSLKGVVTQTQAGDGLSSSAILAITGAFSQTQTSDSLSSTAVITLAGVLNQTQAGNTLSSTATLSLSGVLSQTQADNSLSSTAAITIAGILSQTQSGDSLSSIGSINLAGILSQTQAGDILSSVTVITLSGILSQTQAGDILSASGVIGSIPISGELSQTQAGDSLISSGTIAIKGVLFITQDAQVISGAGTTGGSIAGYGNLEIIKAARLRTVTPAPLETIEAARLKTTTAQKMETLKAERLQNIDR